VRAKSRVPRAEILSVNWSTSGFVNWGDRGIGVREDSWQLAGGGSLVDWSIGPVGNP